METVRKLGCAFVVGFVGVVFLCAAIIGLIFVNAQF